MNPILTGVFELFPEQIGIIGSGITNPESAKDIDVLFLNKEEFEGACKRFEIKWNGWDAWNGHVRIANLVRERKIQLIQISSVTEFDHHPHQVLLRDGSLLHEGITYIKPEGWKYSKWPWGKGVVKDPNE